MAREMDYKHIGRPEVQKQQPAKGQWAKGFLSGVVVATAVLAVTAMNFDYFPRAQPGSPPVAGEPQPGAVDSTDPSLGNNQGFGFYDSLQEPIPLPAPETEYVEERVTYWLQAGSFRTHDKSRTFSATTQGVRV